MAFGGTGSKGEALIPERLPEGKELCLEFTLCGCNLNTLGGNSRGPLDVSFEELNTVVGDSRLCPILHVEPLRQPVCMVNNMVNLGHCGLHEWMGRLSGSSVSGTMTYAQELPKLMEETRLLNLSILLMWVSIPLLGWYSFMMQQLPYFF